MTDFLKNIDVFREPENLQFHMHQSLSGNNQVISYIDAIRISDGHHLGQTMHHLNLSIAEIEYLADKWIKENPTAGFEPPSFFCYSCGLKLISSWDTDYQFDNALWIELQGGYGMGIDSYGEPNPKAVICHDCMHYLCGQHQWLNELINPTKSHAHTREYWEAYPDHEGWDKPK